MLEEVVQEGEKEMICTTTFYQTIIPVFLMRDMTFTTHVSVSYVSVKRLGGESLVKIVQV
jgi:hypothetical protein